MFFRRFLGNLSVNRRVRMAMRSAGRRPYGPEISADQAKNILSKLEKKRELEQLPFLYWILLDKTSPERLYAARVLHGLMHNINGNDLCRADNISRERTSFDYFYAWKKHSPDELVPDGSTDFEKVSIYGFASFHPNGYFREKAVSRLAGIRTGKEIPYLLIRLNDWVDSIRSISKTAIENRLTPEFAVQFVESIIVLKRLENRYRDDHKSIVAKIVSAISGDRNALERGVKSEDQNVRCFCFSLATDFPLYALSDLIELVKAERSGNVRLYALRSLEKRIDSENVREIAVKFMADRYAGVRYCVLSIFCRFYLSEASDILKKEALSDSACMRLFSIFYLRKIGMVNPSDLYRQAIVGKKEGVSAGAILGIGETGTAADAELILPFLRSRKSSIVRAVIKSIPRLKPECLEGCVLPFVADPRPGVSREAALAIIQKPYIAKADTLCGYFRNSQYAHVKKNAIRLLTAVFFWDSLPCVLEACADKDSEVKEAGTNALKSWLARSSGIFTMPTKEQAKNMSRSIADYAMILDARTKKELEFLKRF